MQKLIFCSIMFTKDFQYLKNVCKSFNEQIEYFYRERSKDERNDVT